MKTKDGHQLFQATCSSCGKDRGMLRKKQLNQLCRSCSAKERTDVACQNAIKARLVKNTKVREENTHINFSDCIILPCGVFKYKTRCKECNFEKGYQTISNANDVCRTCYYKQTASQITDIQKQLKKNFASNLYHRLKNRGGSKAGKGTFKIMPYSLTDLIVHLESKFEPGMSWGNYGNGWHIDHVIPDSWFTYSFVEDQGFKDCWTLNNLQPMWALENIRKGNKYSGSFRPNE
jgi:hypothetical protein